MQSKQEYHPLSKLFHWLVVFLVGLEFLIAWIMPRVHRNLAAPPGIVMIHLSVGIVILIVMLLRLVWQLAQKTPRLPAGTPRWQKTVTKATHYALYASLIAMPTTTTALRRGGPFRRRDPRSSNS